MRPIKVLVLNLSTIWSELLQRVLESVSDIEVVHPPQTTDKIFSHNMGSVDLILLGSSTSEAVEGTGRLLTSVREQQPMVRILVLAEDPSYEATVALFRAGANGIISGRDVDFDLLCKGIRCVYQGQVWANNELLKHLVTALSFPKTRGTTSLAGERILTTREQEILDRLSEGLSNAELASTLRLSEHTVKNHLFRIYDKLGVSNRTEATLYALSRPITPSRPGNAVGRAR